MAVRNTRLCVYQDSQEGQKKLVMYPNLAVKGSRLENALPVETKLIAPAKELIRECLANQKLHVELSNRSCELMVVRLVYQEGYQCSTCNATFLTHKSIVAGATVLHVFQSEEDAPIKYCLLNFSPIRRASQIQNNLNKWYKAWRSSVNSKFEQYIAQTEGLFLLPAMETNPMALEFLEERKLYLREVQNHRQLMVPGWKLHPLPSIDLLLFSLPNELERKVTQNGLAYQMSAKPFPCPQSVIYMSGFQSNHQSISFRPGVGNLDYGKVVEATEDSIRWTNQMKQPQKTSLYINHGRSVSVCRDISSNECLMAFQGNTLEGSSGSPLYDSDGRLLGLNFGYLCDHIDDYGKKQHPNPQKPSPFDEDVDLQHLEEQSQYSSFKNLNLAVRIDCPPVLSLLNR